MTYSLKYITDSKGRQRAVQMSVADWKKIEKKLKQAEFLLTLRKDVDEAVEETRLHSTGATKLRSLSSFIETM